MLRLRNAADRGHHNHGWLDTRHTFSFAGYHDEQFMGYRALRVMNEDRVEPGQGFGTHPHADMEIVTYVLKGELKHQDSLGNETLLKAGEVQRITAGTGISHSEFNPSATDPVHFYQVWIEPDRKGLPPSYEQKKFSEADRQWKFQLIASPDGRDGSLSINQDVRIYLGILGQGQSMAKTLRPGRYTWLQVLRGSGKLNGKNISAGDGVSAEGVPLLGIDGGTNGIELMMFDLG